MSYVKKLFYTIVYTIVAMRLHSICYVIIVMMYRSCGCGQEQWDGLDRDTAEVGGTEVEGKVQNDKTRSVMAG